MEPSQTSSPLTEGPWARMGVVAAEESIKLIPKIRPSTTPGVPDYVKYVGHKALTLSAPGAENAHWDFDFVASPHTRQSSFFRVAGRPMADHFLAFYNAAIIAYGQTGSGKTHTMLGNLPSDWATRSLSTSCFEDMPRDAGLIPRVLGYIFQRVAADSQPAGGSQPSGGGPNPKPATPTAGVRHLPQPPPAPAQGMICTTPIADQHARSRARSGIPTPNGVPRATPRTYLTPPPASPQRTPSAVPAPVGPPSRAGKSLANAVGDGGGTEYLIKASMLQIYQEVVTDLLNPRPVRLQIRESMEGGVMVVGLSEITVRSAAEALQLLRVGTSHRAVGETASNPVSSRSHCILTLHMEARDKMDTGVVRIRRSRLQLVDLAGSERTSKCADYGSARQKETNAINKSLSTLGLVISRLTDRTRSQGPVPYRDSKLTFLLQDCLGGNAKTLIIANLNPSPMCASETNMTLGFALRAKRVRNRAVINEDHQGDAVILQGEVRRLREELSIFRTLHAKDGPPQGLEELSAWRDQAVARVSQSNAQLLTALKLNGELEERLASLEAAHVRLRMEHLALEEQCEAQCCEMSALEATVEQCEDELLELRERPTLEQLQAVEQQLQTALRERDDARTEHEEALHQNLQLQDQAEQLSELLLAYQQRSSCSLLAADSDNQGEAPAPAAFLDHDGKGDQQLECGRSYAAGGNEGNLEDTCAGGGARVAPAAAAAAAQRRLSAVVPGSSAAAEYTALEVAYAELQASYAALVEQNRQLLQQLDAAASALEASVEMEHQKELEREGSQEQHEVDDESEDEAGSAGSATHRRPQQQQHRYHLADSCLVSGGLEAVMEAEEDEYYEGEDEGCAEGGGAAASQARPGASSAAAPPSRDADSPSERVRLASPASAGGSGGSSVGGGQRAASQLTAGSSSTTTAKLRLTLPSPPTGQGFCPPPPQQLGPDLFNQMRRRCRSQGSGPAAAAAADGSLAGESDFVVLRRSAPGLPGDSLNGYRDIAPSLFSLNSTGQLGGRLAAAFSAGLTPRSEVSGVIPQEDGDDAADARSLGTLVRVNPLFDCRGNNGEELPGTTERGQAQQPPGASAGANVNPAAEVMSAQDSKSAGSAETAPVGSDSLMCELPMPPNEQLAGASPSLSPWPLQGACCHSDGSDSTAGVVWEGGSGGAEGGAEYSVLSDARDRDRALREIHSPNASVAEPLRHGSKGSGGFGFGLPAAEPSFIMTPCSHPTRADGGGGDAAREEEALEPHSPSRHSLAAAWQPGGGDGPASPAFKFDGFAGEASPAAASLGGGGGGTRSAARRANSASRSMMLGRSARSAASSPLSAPTSAAHNDENACAALTSVPSAAGAGADAAQASSPGAASAASKPLRSSWTAQSLFGATGVTGPTSPGLRLARTASQHTDNRSRTAAALNPSRSTLSPARTATAVLSPPVAKVSCARQGSSPAGSPAAAHRGSSVSCGDGRGGNGGGGGSRGGSARGSPASSQQRRAGGPSWVRAEQLVENVAQLEDELARRLQGEIQLRTKLQEARTEAQSAGAQAANLLALNSGLIEEVAERDDRLRCFEDLVARLYGEMKAIVRQGLRELSTPVQHTRAAAAANSASPPAASSACGARVPAALDGDDAAATTPVDSEPATASPVERPRVKQSYEVGGGGSPLGFAMDAAASPPYLIPLPAASGSASSPSPSRSRGLRASSRDMVPSPLGLMIGSVQMEGPSSAMKTGLMLLLAKLRDGLLERDQRTAGLEEELEAARSRLTHLEQELRRLQGLEAVTQQQAGTEGVPVRGSEGSGDHADDVSRPGDEAAEGAQRACMNEHGFIAPPSPACSDSDPHPPAPWSAGGRSATPCQTSPLESNMRREASLQAQLHSRDCQVFELLDRNEQLEAALQAAAADRDARVAELQSHAARLANAMQTQVWKRDTQITELQNQAAEAEVALARAAADRQQLEATAARSAAEAARFRQQSTEAVEQCERYALELQGLERREELMMNKLRTLEMSLAHRGQELEGLRTDLAYSAEQLAGMRAKAVEAELEAAHARQAAAALEDQLLDLRHLMLSGAQQQPFPPPPPSHFQQAPSGAAHYVATVRPTGGSAGGAAPGHGQGTVTGPGPGAYHYGSRSEGGAVQGHAAVYYQMPGFAPAGHYDLVGGPAPPPVSARPFGGRPSRHSAFAYAAPPPAPMKPVPFTGGAAKGGANRGFTSAPAAAAAAALGSAAGANSGTAAVDPQGAAKGTWVQRFLCRKNVSTDGSPGQEAHVAILTPAKWRTKGMTGIVLRQWVGNTSGKNGSRKVG